MTGLGSGEGLQALNPNANVSDISDVILSIAPVFSPWRCASKRSTLNPSRSGEWTSYLGAEVCDASSPRPLAGARPAAPAPRLSCKLHTEPSFRGFEEVSAGRSRIGTLGEELCQSFDNG